MMQQCEFLLFELFAKKTWLPTSSRGTQQNGIGRHSKKIQHLIGEEASLMVAGLAE
jgi:hypothetical protein